MLMPVVRQGPAPDGNRKAVYQSMSTDVQRARLLPCTNYRRFTHAWRGLKNCNCTLESGHQSGSAGHSPRWSVGRRKGARNPEQDQPHQHGQREPRSYGETHHEMRRVNLNAASHYSISGWIT